MICIIAKHKKISYNNARLSDIEIKKELLKIIRLLIYFHRFSIILKSQSNELSQSSANVFKRMINQILLIKFLHVSNYIL